MRKPHLTSLEIHPYDSQRKSPCPRLRPWVVITMINLCVVALLGFLLRAKLLFSLPQINFKYLLHAHSHFAFGGWVTLALLALFTYRLLPERQKNRKIHKWLLALVLINALGMLFSFPFQGYARESIIFSTLFIFSTYAYAFIFFKYADRSQLDRPVAILASGALIYMVISSFGAFAMAYLMTASRPDPIPYKNAIYSYLHFQYNGFFTLGVFAVLFYEWKITGEKALWFARLLNISVIPSLFLSFLWLNDNHFVFGTAMAGSILLVASLIAFLFLVKEQASALASRGTLAGFILCLALFCFALKTLLLSLTIIPALATPVFANHPLIIGFLHLTLLGFVSLVLISCFVHLDYLKSQSAVFLFTSGILLNEVALMIQGIGFMIMWSGSWMPWLLWLAAFLLFTGAISMTSNIITKVYPFTLRPTNCSRRQPVREKQHNPTWQKRPTM